MRRFFNPQSKLIIRNKNMETIKITKLAVLELIKNSKVDYYDSSTYKDWKIIVEGKYTYIEDDYFVYLKMEDLATLLFDRCFSNDSVLIVVI